MKRRVKSALRRCTVAVEGNWQIARTDARKALVIGLLAIPAAVVATIGIGVAVSAIAMALVIVMVVLGLVSVVLALVPPAVLICLILAPFYFAARGLGRYLPGRRRLVYRS
mgnify:CR=1 FL=1